MPSRPYHILSVVGARPNFMKIAPLVAQLRREPQIFSHTLVHTGQHYDEKMSKVFFDELNIPAPDVNLNIGSGSQSGQTAAIMTAFEPFLIQSAPDLVVVVGDVNSTLACALVAAKSGVPVAHVEAGLRSFDRSMPEEINRLLTDQISDLLFVSEPSGVENLLREGAAPERIHLVGNVMIDTLLAHRATARGLEAFAAYGLQRAAYGVMTLHRPSNVDDPAQLAALMGAAIEISRDLPMLFPVHPRTRANLMSLNVLERHHDRVQLIDPVGYLEFLSLLEASRVVITDSGGIQEESTILGIPCLTVRNTTERPATVTSGTNQVVGTDPKCIIEAWRRLQSAEPVHRVPEFWDGRAADRIVDVLRAGIPA
jgi:UDP-N-acetylglucosamine 2-epimerase (non-hydrolysing)